MRSSLLGDVFAARGVRKCSMRSPGALALAALMGCLGWPASGSPTDFARNPREFLKNEGGLSDLQLSAIDRGRVVAKTIDTSDRSEVMSLAVLRVRSSADQVRHLLREVEARRKDFDVLQIGRFSAAPTAQDLGVLTLDPGDVESLRKCRVGACNERLPAEAIERFQTQVDWTSPDRVAKVNLLWRETLASYAAAYVAHGNPGLVEYDDNREPDRVADTLRTLFLRSAYLKESAPDFHRYLAEFPNLRPPSTEDIFFWLKEKFWLKNVQSLNHLSILDTTLPSGRVILAVTKQLFANHFFEASLALTVFVESADPAGSYLIFVNRTRADVRPSGFSWLERALVRRLVRGRLLGQFRAFKAKLDPSYQPLTLEEDVP
jgi:hypothetical protein